MPVKVKKNKRPKTPKKMSQSVKQNVKQNVVIHLGHKKQKNTGLEKAKPIPEKQGLSFVSNFSTPAQSDVSLLYRELFKTNEMVKKLKNASPFERALAANAAMDDRALQVEQIRIAETDPIRRAVLAPPPPYQQLGLDPGTIPNATGDAAPLADRNPLGFTTESRLSESQLLGERSPAHPQSTEFIREQRLLALKQAPSMLSKILGRIEEPSTVDEAILAQQGVQNYDDARLQERVQNADDLEHADDVLRYDHAEDVDDPTPMEAPERKRDSQSVLGEVHPPQRIQAYLKSHGTAGDIERFARADFAAGLVEQGASLAEAEKIEAGIAAYDAERLRRSKINAATQAEIQSLPPGNRGARVKKAADQGLAMGAAVSFPQEPGLLLSRSDLGRTQGEGLLGAEASAPRQEPGILSPAQMKYMARYRELRNQPPLTQAEYDAEMAKLGFA